MKKTIIIAMFLCFVTAGFSQGSVRFGFTTSPSLGFANPENNLSIADAPTYDKDGSKFGFQYGILADLDISDEERYFIHSGLIMHHTGVKLIQNHGFGPPTPSTSFEHGIQYIEVPLALKLKSNEIGYAKYYGLFGLNAGLKVGDKPKEGASLFDVSSSNLGLNVGGGIEYAVSETTQLLGGLEYHNGFSDVENTDLAKVPLSHLVFRLGVYF